VVEATLMNRGRNTLLLLVVGVAIGAYVYFVEMKRTPASEAATEARPKLFGASLDSAKIEEVKLKSASGERTTLKKTGSTWQIVEPIASGVDESEVSSITSNLSTLEASRTIEENAKDLTKYGLADPRVEVDFKAAGDKDYRRLLVGAKTPTGGDLYAKLANESKVVLIPSYLDSTFDRTTFQLRDKTVLKFDRDKVDSIEIATGPTTMAFAKQGDAWTLTKPWKAQTDSSAVEGLVGRIASGQMKSLAAPEPKDLAEYGLAKPDVRITLGAGSARSGLLIGKATGTPAGPPPATPPAPGSEPSTGEGAYAKDDARAMVFTIDKSLADELKKGPSDYRKKDLLDFRAFNGSKLEVTRTGATTIFEKKKEAGKDAQGKPTPAVDKWTQTQPAKTADASKIEDVATRVGNLRVDSFVEKLPAGATELLTLTAVSDEGKKTEKITVYKAGADYFAIRPDDPGAGKVPASTVDDVVKALDAVK
jgi:Domain of unknown function (DUF4340)